MSAYSFEPRQSVVPARAPGGALIYAESTTETDGVTMTFPFEVSIGTLITGYVGGQAQSPADCSAVAGALALTFAPGDAENVGLIKVGALYLR
jgi:hypothetical protein